MLTEIQRRALLLDMHRSIEEVSTKVASQLVSSTRPTLVYPPNAGLNSAEAQAVGQLKAIPGLESALRKIIASAASEPLYHLVCILDGIGDPSNFEGPWLGARIEPVSDVSDEAQEDVEPLRYDFYDFYWEWRKRRPDPGWRLDEWNGQNPASGSSP
jgi:hypothetical protein